MAWGRPATLKGSPAVSSNDDGRMEIYVTDSAGANTLWHIYETTGGGWSQWRSLGAASGNSDISAPIAFDGTYYGTAESSSKIYVFIEYQQHYSISPGPSGIDGATQTGRNVGLGS